MKASAYDEHGYYTGGVRCQKHPKRRGSYLLPAMATHKKPIPNNDKKLINQFNSETESWALVPNPFYEEVEKPIKLSDAQIIENLKNMVRLQRSDLLREFNIFVQVAFLHDVSKSTRKILAQYLQDLLDLPEQVISADFKIENLVLPEKPRIFNDQNRESETLLAKFLRLFGIR